MAAAIVNDAPSGSRRGVTRTPRFMEWQREINSTRPRKRSEREEEADGPDATPPKRNHSTRRHSSEEAEETERKGGGRGEEAVERKGKRSMQAVPAPCANPSEARNKGHRAGPPNLTTMKRAGKEGLQGGERKGGGSLSQGGGRVSGSPAMGQDSEAGAGLRQSRASRRSQEDGQQQQQQQQGGGLKPGGSRRLIAPATLAPAPAAKKGRRQNVRRRTRRLPRASLTPPEEEAKTTRKPSGFERGTKSFKSKRLAQREVAPAPPPLKMPKLHLALTKKEINDDWLTITGHKYSGKPKKSTLVQRGLGLCTALIAPSSIRYLADPQ